MEIEFQFRGYRKEAQHRLEAEKVGWSQERIQLAESYENKQKHLQDKINVSKGNKGQWSMP